MGEATTMKPTDSQRETCSYPCIAWGIIVTLVVVSLLCFSIYFFFELKEFRASLTHFEDMRTIDDEIDIRSRAKRSIQSQCTCVKGEPGTPGPRGKRGFRGVTGSIGSPGHRGLSGLKGEPGMKGDEGPKGMIGFVGQQGERGYPGAPGEAGLPGLKGDSGIKGSAGLPGQPGPRGEPGEAGFPGEIGYVGEPGQKGEPGEYGYPGETGEPGMPGERGLRGRRGPKGNIGAQGLPGGLPGTPGLKGQKGEPGSLNAGEFGKQLTKRYDQDFVIPKQFRDHSTMTLVLMSEYLNQAGGKINGTISRINSIDEKLIDQSSVIDMLVNRTTTITKYLSDEGIIPSINDTVTSITTKSTEDYY